MPPGTHYTTRRGIVNSIGKGRDNYPIVPLKGKFDLKIYYLFQLITERRVNIAGARPILWVKSYWTPGENRVLVRLLHYVYRRHTYAGKWPCSGLSTDTFQGWDTGLPDEYEWSDKEL